MRDADHGQRLKERGARRVVSHATFLTGAPRPD